MFYPRWLLHYVRRPAVTAFPHAPDPEAPYTPPELLTAAPQFRRSLALRHLDSGSCNGCEAELQLLGSPVYDLSRFGFGVTPSPRHADVLVVTGVVTEAMVPILRSTYEAMPGPKLVLAVGACARDGGVFAGAPGIVGDLSRVLPVAARVPGCPPSPNDMLGALLSIVGRKEVIRA
jgi:membrane-bound hydrogenase subunit mbhJ